MALSPDKQKLAAAWVAGYRAGADGNAFDLPMPDRKVLERARFALYNLRKAAMAKPEDYPREVLDAMEAVAISTHEEDGRVFLRIQRKELQEVMQAIEAGLPEGILLEQAEGKSALDEEAEASQERFQRMLEAEAPRKTNPYY